MADPRPGTDMTHEPDAGISSRPEGATKSEFDAHLAHAERNADLGLPVGSSERFRLAKRVVAKISWPFLRHQIAFNHGLVQSSRDLADRIAILQERIEQDIRNDLLDFADRSVSQAHAEIGNHVAEARRVNADLIQELRSLQEELNAMAETASRARPSEQTPLHLEGQQDDAETDGSTHESPR
jgi:hypothetical protein